MRYGLTLATAFLILLGHAAIAQVSTSANLTIGVVPGITLSPTSLTYGSQLVGTTSVAQTTTFHNAATVAVVPTISITGTNSAEFSQSATCASPLPSGGNCTVSVTFTPSGAGTRMAALTISAPGGYTYTAGLSGTGTAVAPSITFTPNTLTFASQVVGTSSASKSLVARNGGNVTETISGISLTGSNPGDYSQTNNCPGSLAVNATCTINVTFTPTIAGTRTANVSVAANGGPYTAALSGTAAAAAPLVTFAPSSLTFASQTLNTSSPSQAVVATNAGNVAVVISGVTLTGSNPGDYSLAPAGTCSGTLAVAATCTVNVTFTPTVTGTRTASISVAGNGGPYTAALTGTGGGTFPLVVSSGVLKTQGGAPFLMVGDTPQSIMGKLPVCTAGNTFALCQNSADALPTQTMVAFFRDRAAHGFNTEQINIFCDTGFSCGTDAPTLADGVTHPFTGTLSGCVTGDQTCYDLATPNTAYFTAVDAMIQMAGKFNQNVLLTLGNPKCNGDGTRGAGFIGTLFKNNAVSSAKVTGFGTFIGTRYNAASFPNIVYQFGNDYLCYQTAADDNPAFAFMTAVKTADTNHLQTMQASFNLSTSLDNTTNNWAGLLSLNGAYTYYPPYDDITHARAQNLTKPAFVIESNYEGEDNLGCNTPSTSRDRKTLWWTFMSGGQGYIYGSQYSWPFAPGWNTASNIDTADVTQISYLYNFLNPLAWSTLVPDIGHTLVTAGFGTYANAPFTYGVPGGVCAVAGQNVADNTYVTSAKSSNGALALAYLPSNATITANMATLGTSATAVWYDPTKDPALGSSYTAICSPTGTNCASGSTTFKPSNQGLAAHTDGANDWVLKITATPVSGSSITGIALSNNSFTAPASDGTVVGSITVPGNNNSAATLSIIGTDAARFRLSSTTVPSNLLVNGTQSCNSSNCSVSLVATLAGATGSPFTQAETITGVGGGSATAYLSAASTILPVANGATSANTTTPHGSSAILTWDSSNAASCNATSGNFSTSGTSSGTLTVSPTANTTY